MGNLLQRTPIPSPVFPSSPFVSPFAPPAFSTSFLSSPVQVPLPTLSPAKLAAIGEIAQFWFTNTHQLLWQAANKLYFLGEIEIRCPFIYAVCSLLTIQPTGLDVSTLLTQFAKHKPRTQTRSGGHLAFSLLEETQSHKASGAVCLPGIGLLIDRDKINRFPLWPCDPLL
jgi:hypothetical protein